MRKFVLSSVSAVALTLAGAAYADSDSAAAMDENSGYGSYNANTEFDGSIAGGYSAEELIGADIVNTDGDTIDEVSDLLIDQNNEITHVLVNVGGVLGIGTKTVALSIDELQVPEGSSDDVMYMTSMTEEQLEELPAYFERDGVYWMDADVDVEVTEEN